MKFGTISVALFAVVGLLAGCGGSSSSGSSQSTATSTAASVSSAAANASGSSGSGSNSSSSSSSSGSSAGASFASSHNCQQLAALGAKYLRDVSPSSGGAGIDLAAAVKADQALADASPSAIHADAETVVHGFSGYVATLGKLGYKPGTQPTASQLAGLQSAAAQFSQPGFRSAMQRVAAWIRQNCHGVTG
jgi:hypothetical protein